MPYDSLANAEVANQYCKVTERNVGTSLFLRENLRRSVRSVSWEAAAYLGRLVGVGSENLDELIQIARILVGKLQS